MSSLPSWGYLAAFLGAAVLSLGLTPIARKLAISLGVLDHPGDYKQQRDPVPYLGGLAIVASFAVAISAAAVIIPDVDWREPTMVLGLAVGLSIVGLIDDIRHLSPWTRLALQTAAAVGLVSTGTQVTLFESHAINLVLSVLWVVGVSNAFNLLDNMDGLTAGLAAIASGSLFLVAALNGQFLVAALAAALAGSALGFLWHNYHPAAIYMGDAGSLFFGFVIAGLGIKLRFPGPNSVTFFVPILIVGVALLDTTLVTFTRLARRKSPFSGGRDHVSHRLMNLGLSVRAAVGTIYVVGMALGWMAAVMSRIDRTSGYLLMGLVSSLGLASLVMLARVPIHEPEGREDSGLTGAKALESA